MDSGQMMDQRLQPLKHASIMLYIIVDETACWCDTFHTIHLSHSSIDVK